MIPVDPYLCEIVEAALLTEENRINALLEMANDFLEGNKRLCGQNLGIWPPHILAMHFSRNDRYRNVIKALEQIKTNKMDVYWLFQGRVDSKDLFNQMNEEYSSVWEQADFQERKDILEEILVPHLMIVRGLEKYRPR